ncbi:MAG: sulfur carrier protein ThiS adenylyltransferase ThiF [Candidatus Omnitrophica bacterium]|nr:sulfur carrier protein ThiS adenylyltransferase ThiF [Candidatus Omnitrophota bacterium]
MNLFHTGLLRYLKPEQLDRLRQTRVGIAGCGGLGSNIAVLLTRSGLENFILLDRDTVEASNLNRQFFFLSDIGRPKTGALTQYLRGINPEVKTVLFQETWSPQNPDRFAGCDIVVEAFDRAGFKKSFVEFYQSRAKYVISGNGMAGYQRPQPLAVRQIKNIFIVGDATTDITNGFAPFAPRVTACAGLMADIALSLVLN